MARARDEPYVWVTWITRLMAGEAHCEWSAWFRAHHTYDKSPSDFDLATWTARHTAMVRQRVAALKSDGFEVFLESQNAFKLRGTQGTVLAGKPDIVAVRGQDAKVIDCKTGAPKMGDHFQVLTYMIVLPFTHPACKGKAPDGEVQYTNDVVDIPSTKATPELRALFRETVHRIGGQAPLPRVPSYDECRFCDITAADCPQRVESPTTVDKTDHDLF
ncbi:MAG: PD-(D/E)XK nuclease family protein [Planctomycetota bacterium]|jgi:hypothetical protein